MLTKTEASLWLLGYEDRDYINYLLHEGYLGIRLLPNKKTNKIIYEEDLRKFVENLPYLNAAHNKKNHHI